MAYGYRVYAQVERPPQEIVARLAAFSSADLSDAMNMAGTMDPGLLPAYRPIARIAGPAVTVSVPLGSQNLRKMAMQLAGPGDVLVINGRGSLNTALLGANVGLGLKRRGLAGLIVDGAVRDISGLKELDLPVFCRGLTTLAGPKEGPGEVNVPVACGGVVVNPGDVIVADEDGIVVVPSADATSILGAATDLTKHLASVQPQLRAGEVTNIEAVERQLRSSGCEFVDSVATPA